MKKRFLFLRSLALVVIALTTTMVETGCNRIGNATQSISKKSPLVGKYTLIGQHEAASEIELYDDGNFVYAMVYGAQEEGAEGKWRSTNTQVILEVDKSRQGKAALPPTDKLELRRDGDKLVWSRNDNELVYLKAPSSVVTDDQGKKIKPSHFKEIDILGFNYTDKFIDAFNVNGHSGGAVSLSSDTAGGGSARCCFRYFPGVGFPYEIEVEWGSSERWGPTQKTKVFIPKPKVPDPEMLEIHFYPDGHVEGELIEGYSAPRLKLTKKNDYER